MTEQYRKCEQLTLCKWRIHTEYWRYRWLRIITTDQSARTICIVPSLFFDIFPNFKRNSTLIEQKLIFPQLCSAQNIKLRSLRVIKCACDRDSAIQFSEGFPSFNFNKMLREIWVAFERIFRPLGSLCFFQSVLLEVGISTRVLR